tara:strand:- start:63 stop:182 length:120 start_codon:yes stop_codon:yes gene_type:complete
LLCDFIVWVFSFLAVAIVKDFFLIVIVASAIGDIAQGEK